MTDIAERSYDVGAVKRALTIGPGSPREARTIDITTLGRRTGRPRRIEIWFHHVDGRWYLSGMPVPRNWHANLSAHPHFTFHLKNGVRADLPATAVPVEDPAVRYRVLSAVVGLQDEPGLQMRVTQRQRLEDWLKHSPLIEIVFDDARLRRPLS
ncbi:nitroreductase/quinone reductase family protein [Rhodococcus sp. NPDC127530]|uniref:nitroreductase/quinone reductase family protein n=1 Tax=unclassified Rhodococcus (in: high G+C Gram-positive bacteria) TaxID=192944 RepID=UPI0036307559